MKITREDVLRVAELANLELTEAEIRQYGSQLEAILSYCEKLNELDTAKVEPMAQVLTTVALPQGSGQASGPSASLGAGEQPFDAAQGKRVASEDQDLREDVPVKADVVGEVLKGAPDPAPPYFRVPKVIDR